MRLADTRLGVEFQSNKHIEIDLNPGGPYNISRTTYFNFWNNLEFKRMAKSGSDQKDKKSLIVLRNDGAYNTNTASPNGFAEWPIQFHDNVEIMSTYGLKTNTLYSRGSSGGGGGGGGGGGTSGMITIGHVNAKDDLVVSNLAGTGTRDVQVDSTGKLAPTASDKRLKKNIVYLNSSIDKINGLKPCTFEWKEDEKNTTVIGLIAQDVEKVIPEAVFINESNGMRGLHYKYITATMIKGMQDQQKIINHEIIFIR